MIDQAKEFAKEKKVTLEYIVCDAMSLEKLDEFGIYLYIFIF